MGDPALVLLGLPIELEGSDGAEFGEGRVEDGQIDVVAQVDPHEDEEAKVGADDGGVEVVECFRSLENDSINIVGIHKKRTYG